MFFSKPISNYYIITIYEIFMATGNYIMCLNNIMSSMILSFICNKDFIYNNNNAFYLRASGSKSAYYEAAKKVLFLIARPFRPYPHPRA